MLREIEAGLDGWSSVPGRCKISLLHNFHTGSEAKLASYVMSVWSCYYGVKQQERDADHAPPSRAEVKNGGNILVSPLLYMSS
jgi:hypothetical protein